MRRLDWKVIVLLCIIISVAVGFLYGTGILGGDSKDPGSADDPLVSQSGAEAALEQKVSDMDVRINSLEAKIQTLEAELEQLTGPAAPVTPPGTTPGAGGTTTPPAGGTAVAGSNVTQADIGKSAAVTGDVVNLRESGSTSSAIKRKLSPSDTFTITKVDRDWCQVQLADGTTGWVAGYLVRVK